MKQPAIRWTALQIHPDDNVICLLRDHDSGERPVADGVEAPALTTAVSCGHKIALCAIADGDLIIKYGHPIGRATRAIEPGDHVHLHNIEGLSEDHKG